MTEQLAEILGKIVGSFVAAFIAYNLFKMIIYSRNRTLPSLLLTFIFSVGLIVVVIGYGEYNYISPLFTHVPFVILLTLIDLIKLIKAKKKEVSE